MTARMIYLHALTPIHSGTGQAASIIDLPIAREKTTGYPILPASSLKGVLRDGSLSDAAKFLYGDSDDAENSRAGALIFGDQKLLCFPARSLYGTFAYITCPLVLRRYERDLSLLGIDPPSGERVDVPDKLDIRLAATGTLDRKGKTLLEDLDLKAGVSAEVSTVATALAEALFPSSTEEQKAFINRFGVVHEDVFSYLVQTATEVTARIALEQDTKTVKDGGLWYEEAVPSEAIFFGPLLVGGHVKDERQLEEGLSELASRKSLSIGGKSTVGRGLCRIIVSTPSSGGTRA